MRGELDHNIVIQRMLWIHSKLWQCFDKIYYQQEDRFIKADISRLTQVNGAEVRKRVNARFHHHKSKKYRSPSRTKIFQKKSSSLAQW